MTFKKPSHIADQTNSILCEYCGQPAELGYTIKDRVNGLIHRYHVCQNEYCARINSVERSLKQQENVTGHRDDREGS